MTVNGTMTADARYLCGIAELLVEICIHVMAALKMQDRKITKHIAGTGK